RGTAAAAAARFDPVRPGARRRLRRRPAPRRGFARERRAAHRSAPAARHPGDPVMKFLCIACDEPMKLEESTPPTDVAGFTATFRCPASSKIVTMLTNPKEIDVEVSL